MAEDDLIRGSADEQEELYQETQDAPTAEESVEVRQRRQDRLQLEATTAPIRSVTQPASPKKTGISKFSNTGKLIENPIPVFDVNLFAVEIPEDIRPVIIETENNTISSGPTGPTGSIGRRGPRGPQGRAGSQGPEGPCCTGPDLTVDETGLTLYGYTLGIDPDAIVAVAGISVGSITADILHVADQIKFPNGMTAASVVTTVNGVSGDVTLVDLVGVATFNGAAGDVQGVSSFNGATGGITSSNLILHVAGLSCDGGSTFGSHVSMGASADIAGNLLVTGNLDVGTDSILRKNVTHLGSSMSVPTDFDIDNANGETLIAIDTRNVRIGDCDSAGNGNNILVRDSHDVITLTSTTISTNADEVVLNAATVRLPDELQHNGDSDTKLSFPSANNLVLTAGGITFAHGTDAGLYAPAGLSADGGVTFGAALQVDGLISGGNGINLSAGNLEMVNGSRMGNATNGVFRVATNELQLLPNSDTTNAFFVNSTLHKHNKITHFAEGISADDGSTFGAALQVDGNIHTDGGISADGGISGGHIHCGTLTSDGVITGNVVGAVFGNATSATNATTATTATQVQVEAKSDDNDYKIIFADATTGTANLAAKVDSGTGEDGLIYNPSTDLLSLGGISSGAGCTFSDKVNIGATLDVQQDLTIGNGRDIVFDGASSSTIIQNGNQVALFDDANGLVRFPIFAVDIEQRLTHVGDSDTYLDFTPDNIKLSAGGNVFLDADATNTTIEGSTLDAGIIHTQGISAEAGVTFSSGVSVTGGSTFGSAINFQDNQLERPKFKDYAETVNAIGTITGNTAIDFSSGNVQTVTGNGNCEFSFTNPPATGNAGTLTLLITNGGANTTTWASAVKWPGDVAPTLTASGIDILSFVTIDAGSNIYGFVGGINFS